MVKYVKFLGILSVILFCCAVQWRESVLGLFSMMTVFDIISGPEEKVVVVLLMSGLVLTSI